MIVHSEINNSGHDYATFGQVGEWKIVGLSISQINEYVNWRTAEVDKAKALWPPICGSKYWKQMHKFDKHNKYRINFYVTKFEEVTQLDANAPAIYFADTIIRKP